jgi:DNA helicase II / ATP-dependent DNA helicase PcrA
MDEYLTHVEKTYFSPTDLWVKRYPVPEWFIREKFEAYHRLPLLKRFAEIARDIEENVKFYYGYDIHSAERLDIRKKVTAMFRITNLRELYRDFYDWMGRPELFKLTARGRFEYADVFPYLYMKVRLEGVKTYLQVQHLLIDEMQDYTPVQYAVLSRLFHCKMTILGDINQSVNPYSASSQEVIRRVFPGSDAVRLLRSYRSTYEITRFAQQISPNEELIAIERHGEKPVVAGYKNPGEELGGLKQMVRDFEASPHRTLGIICKTQKQAAELMAGLEGLGPYIHLLTLKSATFGGGIILTTAHMAKGLEFDWVVVPFATAGNYNNSIDKSMLYISCTRAMHRLTLTYHGKVSGFVPGGY